MRIYLFKRSNSRFWQMKWTDEDGVDHRESTKMARKADAKDVAARKQEELNHQSLVSEIGVEYFMERYEAEFLDGKSPEHRNKFRNAFKLLVASCGADLLTDITPQSVALFANEMRQLKKSASTIDGYLGYIDRALKWAVRAEILRSNPLIERPRVPDDDCAKGRPLTLEEIERMEMQIESIVGPVAKPSFEFLMTGLRLSGLRLGEAMRLWWRDGDEKKIIVEVGAHVLLSIPARGQKKRRRQVYPVVPEFAKFLLSIPVDQRTGPVFNPIRKDGERFSRVDTVSKKISDMGKAAGIVVKHDDETGEVFYASAQDLRRTFGLKWAKLVPSLELKTLMRHQDIKTTEKYYAIEDANAAAASLEARFGCVENYEKARKTKEIDHA